MKTLTVGVIVAALSGCATRGPYVRTEDRRAVDKALGECKAELEELFKDHDQPILIFNGQRFDACMARRGWEIDPKVRVPY